MTTIIDYVVLNATFSSTTINLVNFRQLNFFFCSILPWRAATEENTFLTSLFIQLIQLIWSHRRRPSLHWKIRKDADIRPFPKRDPGFEKIKGRVWRRQRDYVEDPLITLILLNWSSSPPRKFIVGQ